MGKFLQTCFLAVLCLAGSPSSAQSRVADSLSEAPLHPSALHVSPYSGDTHRGGETLSNTFPFEEFGLFSRYLDSGAGEETLRLQPAPVTVFAHPTPVIHHPASVIGHPTPLPSSVSGLPSQTGFSLVDDAIYPGQEEAIPSASEGETAPVAAFVETRSDTLTIGDQIPSGIEFSEVLQFDSDKLRLDDFRGKYVILEFWAPTCSLSTGSLPEMGRLQDHYGDRLAILPMTIFPERRVQEVLSTYSILQNLDIPLILNAQKMREFFPHSLLPHFVILDPEGRVVAITSQSDITVQNLDKMLDGDELDFREKKDKRINLDRNARLISESPQVENKNIWFQSAMTGYIPGLGGSVIQDYSGLSHIRIVNMSILSHFQLAYSQRDLVDYFGRNRIETPGFGPEELYAEKVGQDAHDWMEEGTHVFGYELIAPPHLNPYELMQQDLNRFFPQVKASVQRKNKTVYALVQLEGQEYPKAIAGKQAYQANGNGVRMRNYPLQGFVYHLNSSFQQNSPYPIINHTGIDYPIDLSLDVKLSNLESLREALRVNGLDLVKQEEAIAVLVLEKVESINPLAP